MQLLGADTGEEDRPGGPGPTTQSHPGGSGAQLEPAPPRRGLLRALGRTAAGARHSSRRRLGTPRRRGRIPAPVSDHTPLPAPLLTPHAPERNQHGPEHPIPQHPIPRHPRPRQTRPTPPEPGEQSRDRPIPNRDASGIPWPRSAGRGVTRAEDPTARADPDGPDRAPRDQTIDPPPAGTQPFAIDLSDGPRLIRHPAPALPQQPSDRYEAFRPDEDGDRPEAEFAPHEEAERVRPARDLRTGAGRSGPDTAIRAGRPGTAAPVGGLPTDQVPGATGRPATTAGVDLLVDPTPVPVVAVRGEPRRLTETLLVTVLSVIASAGAWSLAVSGEVWLTLSALPATGLLALLLPGGSAAQVLRAVGVAAVAATLPVLDPTTTPISLVIVTAAAGTYPLLLSTTAARLVTAANVSAPVAALTARLALAGPDRFTQLLRPQEHPEAAVQIALGSGVLVAGLVGVGATRARSRFARATDAAVAAQLRARTEAADVLVTGSLDLATGLPNRDGLLRALALDLTGPDPLTHGSSAAPVGLVLADLDRFDELADRFGPRTADALAAQIGRRIADRLTGHLIARVSRRQFAVVLSADPSTGAGADPTAVNADGCARVAREVIGSTAEPVTGTGHREMLLTCSLGGALSGPGLSTAEDLLQAADEAVRTARRERPDRWAMFDRTARTERRQQADLADELRQAIGRGLIEVDFQPILTLGQGPTQDRITGARVVPRWRRRDGAGVAPEVFVPLADELGLGCALGLQTINRALAALVVWRHEGAGIEQLWLQLSAGQLQDPDFGHEVAAQLAIRGLGPTSLLLAAGAGELNEQTTALANLRVLRSLGIPLALSDFGRSGTSVTMLRRLPVGSVELDARLTADLEHGDDVPPATVTLCRTLGLRVVCPAVRTSGQLEAARQIGVHAVRGQAIARPMSAPDLTNLLTVRLAGPTARP